MPVTAAAAADDDDDDDGDVTDELSYRSINRSND